MKKLFAFLLVAVMIFSLAACGENTDKPSGGTDKPGTSQGGENKNEGWPTSGLGANIPEPDWEYEIYKDSDIAFIATWENMTPDELRPYIQKLEDAGFLINYESGEGSSWACLTINGDINVRAQVEDGRVLVEPAN